jgi:chromosome segregation ATPase
VTVRTLPAVRPLTRPSHLALVAALALGLAACGGGDDEVAQELTALRAATEARADEEGALVERVEALEEDLALLTAPLEEGEEVEDPLAGLQAAIDALEDRLTALSETATTTDEATAAARSAADAAASDLRASLDQVRTATDEVRGEVEELRTLYESLRDRVDRHDRERH